jgi:hypothetical protein
MSSCKVATQYRKASIKLYGHEHIKGFHILCSKNGLVEDSSLLGCNAVMSDTYLPKPQRSTVASKCQNYHVSPIGPVATSVDNQHRDGMECSTVWQQCCSWGMVRKSLFCSFTFS